MKEIVYCNVEMFSRSKETEMMKQCITECLDAFTGNINFGSETLLMNCLNAFVDRHNREMVV